MDDIEKDLTSSRYLKKRLVVVDTSSNMSDISERLKVAQEIQRTIESIRKKHRALKIGRMEEDIATKSLFKPIVEPLQKIADSTSVRAIKDEPGDVTRKREREEDEEEDTIKTKRMFATPRKSHAVPSMTSTPRMTIVQPIESFENVFETTDDSLATAVQHEMQTAEGREALSRHLGPLGRKYVEAVLSDGGRDSAIDHVYGVYLDKDGMMFGNKKFDVDSTDHIIIDGVRYAGTPGLYELIFKKIPDYDVYTEDDLQKYKNMLLVTNAHKHKHHSQGRLLANRGHKYRFVIMPLLKGESKIGKGIPRAMTLNDNAIDYVHWDDPNELVDRLRLLDASRRAGNNMHDNEMLSIIEELREAGLIIN